VKALLDSKASVALVDIYANTALMSAAAYGHVEIVQLFAIHGANVNAVNSLGKTPMMLAS